MQRWPDPQDARPAELPTPAEMARLDAACVAGGVPVATLMERAGWAVARAVRKHLAPCPTLVLCGPGNNGGDGRVAARLLARAGWPVEVAAPLHDDVSPARVARAGLVIDAAFGAGLSRPLPDKVADLLRRARHLVAVDVPSGLDGATGQVRGWAPQADLTVTFVRLKPGHVLLPGRRLCGTVVLADLGIPAAVLGRALAAAAPWTFLNGPRLWALPSLAQDGHKYDRGHVTVCGGPEMTGAARLAASAALRGGAGMVSIAADAAGAPVYRAGEAGVIVTTAPLAALLDDPRRRVWVCGPGLGAAQAADLLPVLLGAAGRLAVVDADALTLCAGAPDRLRGAAVLTPHEGEFARVFGPIGPDRLAAARAAAARTGAVVLLKGPDTVVAAPDGRASVNDSAPPWLATAGAGDVLAGLIGALLARGMDPWHAASAAAWLHGRAAMRLGPGMIAQDLPGDLLGHLPDAIGAIACPR